MKNQDTPKDSLNQSEFDLLVKTAESGNSEAQNQLGMIYANGSGIDLDYSKAFIWLEKAAKQNHVQALRTLAWLYANGFGIEQNDKAAQDICYQLAELGDAKDQYYLASLYQTGVYGMKPDSEKMIHWYYKSALQQYARAQYALAKIIIKGVDIEPNDEMAFQWLSLADINGHQKAGEELKKLIETIPADALEIYKQRMRASIEAASQASS